MPREQCAVYSARIAGRLVDQQTYLGFDQAGQFVQRNLHRGGYSRANDHIHA